jgi:hypothetical protein
MILRHNFRHMNHHNFLGRKNLGRKKVEIALQLAVVLLNLILQLQILPEKELKLL